MSRRKYRRSTTYKVEFPTAPSLTIQPMQVELIQEHGSHDILILEYNRSSSLWFEVLKTGTPIIFSWNQDGKRSRWAGYVTVVTKQSASQTQRMMRIICVGTSFVLKARSNRVFKNNTISEAVEKIAKEFNFKFVGAATNRRFDSLSLAGQSYWEWMQEQAARIGHVVLVQNGVLYFKPADKLIDVFMSNSAILSGEPPGPVSDRNLFDRTLDSFTILNSDYLEHPLLPHRSTRVTAGINPLTGALLSSEASPSNQTRPFRQLESNSLFRDFSDEVVHSTVAARQAATEEARARKFSLIAEIIGQGDPAIHPYSTVLVEGTGVETDGYWVTASVTHQLKITGEYQIEGRVMSDGLGRTLSTPFRRADGSAYGQVNLEAAVINSLDIRTVKSSGLKLINRVPVVLESQQGFVNLGSIWSGR
jgi:phage protein D